jgi:hypothetical protein
MDSYYNYMGESTIWGKLQESPAIILGFNFAVIVTVLFVLPREKKWLRRRSGRAHGVISVGPLPCSGERRRREVLWADARAPSAIESRKTGDSGSYSTWGLLMKESTILETTRKYSLWIAIVSSVMLLVLLILWAWGAFNLTNMDSMFYMDSLDLPLTAWGKVMLTLSAITSTATSILLALLIAKYAKKKVK